MNERDTGARSWSPMKGEFVVLFPYEGGPGHLKLNAREEIEILESSKCGKWYRGKNKLGMKGIFPMMYVGKARTGSMHEDIRMGQLNNTLVEWSRDLKNYYIKGEMDEFGRLYDRFGHVENSRRQILSPEIADREKEEIYDSTLKMIEESKRLMGLDMIVRTSEGEPADEYNTGVNLLLDKHMELAQSDLASGISSAPLESKSSLMESSANLVASVGGKSPSPRGRNQRKRKDSLQGKETCKEQVTQLHFNFVRSMLISGEEMQLFFYLYHRKLNKPISESFIVTIDAAGAVVGETSPGSKQGIFVDLLPVDMDEVFLVCKALKTSLMVPEKDDKPKSKKKDKQGGGRASKPTLYRRPFGVGVLHLTDAVLASKGEATINLYKWKGNDENHFATLAENLVKKNMTATEALGSNAVKVGINRYKMRMSQFEDEFAVLCQDAPRVPKLLFPESFAPGEERSDFYVTIDSADFSAEAPSNMNCEVVICLRSQEGKLLVNAISLGYGDKDKSILKSFVVFHSNQPVWKETFRIHVVPEVFRTAHLHMNITMKEGKADKKNKIVQENYGYTFMPLCSKTGAVIVNGEHVLPIYRNPKESVEDIVYYLKDTGGEKLLRKNQRMVVTTHLSSALLTQNENLLQLQAWNANQDNLAEILKKVTFMERIEILKFIKEIFDAMFSILDAKEDVADSVYDTLVFIIGIVVDDKASQFSDFRNVLDDYVDQHFNGKKAHKTLMTCLQGILNKLDSPQHARAIRDSMKALEYIFRFVVASRVLYTKVSFVSEADTGDFKQNLMECLASFNALMMQTAPALIGAQATALKNFGFMLFDLSKIYEVSDLATIACTFICSIPFDESKKALNAEKLNLIHELVSSIFYTKPESRATLIPTVLNMLSLHMDKGQDSLVQCVSILGTMLDRIQMEFVDDDLPLATWELVPLLPQLVESANKMPMDAGADRLQVVTCILSFFHLMQPYMFDQYLQYIDDTEIFLQDTFTLCLNVLKSSYPPSWFVMCMFAYATILKVARVLGPHIQFSFNDELWTTFFDVLYILAVTPGMQLEQFPVEKQEATLNKYGDMRIDVIQTIAAFWEALASSKPTLLPMMISCTLDLLSLAPKEAQQEGIRLLMMMIDGNLEAHGDLEHVGSKVLDKLEIMLEKGDALQSLLLPALEEKFKGASGKMKTYGDALLLDVGKMVDLLGELQRLRVLSKTTSCEEELVAATMKLMEYLRTGDRRDAYIRYVHILSEQQATSNNPIEAALTLQLHIDLLAFDFRRMLPACGPGRLPEESEGARKVALLGRAAAMLEIGKDWERAAGELSRVAQAYREAYMFGRAAEYMRREAALLERISTTERFFPEFFRVGFYGTSFPAHLRNKSFVYRGFELERLGDFSARIQAKYPNSEILKSTADPDEGVRNSSGMHLLITPLEVASSTLARGEKEVVDVDIPLLIRQYQYRDNAQWFMYAKTFRKAAEKSSNEFADLWIMKYFYRVATPFPSFTPTSEIVEVVALESSPINNAVEAILSKTADLNAFIEKHSHNPEINSNPFTMALNGVIDAAVNGGLANYKDAFLTPDYSAAHPEDAELVTALRLALAAQMECLQRGIDIHARLVPDAMKGLHDHMVTAFHTLKEQVVGTVE